MPKSDDETQKLVEEIRLLWCEECSEGPLSYELGYDPEVDGPCEAKDLCTERARKVVTRTLQAVAGGMPLIGEKGRWKWPTGDRPGEGYADWATRMLETGDEMLIALSPAGTGAVERKEGTGKEEE